MKELYFDRVREHTPAEVNERIDLLTRARIEKISGFGRDAIVRRIAELDHEWDIDRAMMLNFAALGGAVFAAGALKSRGWFHLLTAQFFFLGLHAINGWCPPASIFRRMNFRTRSEIEAEKRELFRILEQGQNKTSRQLA